jgi:peptidoglycan-N-acetylglucosamine deacetylase
VGQLLRKMSGLPWAFIALFNLAAFVALAFAIALLTGLPGKKMMTNGNSNHDAKRIALSFDDSPRGPGAFLNANARPQMLISAMRAAGVKQAVFFVNPGRIDASNGHAKILRAYTDAGHVLANHTANHLQLSNVSTERFLADIDDAEVWLNPHPGYRPWFRFPELDEGGRDASKRDAIRAGLKARGLRNGYVTADGWDWQLDSLARKAAASGERLDLNALRALYVENHVEAAEFADRLARKALGRPPAQVLLLHDTDLAALYLGDMVKALREKGWTIITADEAYADPIASARPLLPDTNGTLIQMLAREKGVPGPYWFERNEVKVMKRLFAERVLRDR